MAESNFRGPLTSMGSLEVQGGTAANIEPMDGPAVLYQGVGIADIRGVPFAKDGTQPGRQPVFADAVDTFTVDAIPQTFSSTVIAAAQSLIGTGTMTLATLGLTNPNPASQFIAVQVPILPTNTSNVTTANIALDFGFTTATTVAASTTVTATDNTKFQVGQWIIIGNAGNSTASASLIAQVVAINTSNFTGITISQAAVTALCAPVGQGNLYQVGGSLLPPAASFGPTAPVATFHSPSIQGGLARVHDPREALARAVSVTVQPVTATSGAFTFIVSGWDVWRQPMVETLTQTLATTTATTIWGKKAFKYISSVICSAQQTTCTASVGVSDIFGLPIRADYNQYCEVQAGNTTVINAVGFTGAVSTTGSPATATTGDVRGTWQISGIGSGAGLTNPATTNGALRLTIVQSVSQWQMLYGTPLNTVPMFGVPQATAT